MLWPMLNSVISGIAARAATLRQVRPWERCAGLAPLQCGQGSGTKPVPVLRERRNRPDRPAYPTFSEEAVPRTLCHPRKRALIAFESDSVRRA